MNHFPSHGTWRALVLLSRAMLVACSTGAHRTRRHYAQSMDSATNSCRHNPAYCTAAAGEEAVVPSAAQVAAAVGTAAAAALEAIKHEQKVLIEQALKECADEARSEVLIQHMEGRSPTPEECMEIVRAVPGGEDITRARWLGEEMHRVALDCVDKRFTLFLAGRYSLEPRYRYDPKTQRVEWLGPEEVKALLNRGRAAELKGSIAPDVVILLGNPLLVQLIYDFKFSCVNTDRLAPWRVYSRDSPYKGRTQNDVYWEILRAPTKRVQPRIGVEL